MKNDSVHGAAAWIVGAAFAIAVGGLPSTARASTPTPTRQAGTWFAEKVTQGDTPLRIDYLWSKGRKLHAQTVIAGHPIVTIVNGSRYYILDPLEREGIAIERSSRALAADRHGGRPFGHEGDDAIAAGAEKVATQRVGGHLCDLYRITDDAGREEVWLEHKRPHLPLRVQIFDRESGSTIRSDYVDWGHGMKLPDSFFEPDPGIKIERMSYQDYVNKTANGPVGPAPPLYDTLLYGPQEKTP